MFKMSSFCLHASPEALALLGNSTVDNPLIIHSRPHTRLHPSYIMASEQSRFESCRLEKIGVYRYTGKGNISADKWNISGSDISAELFGPIFFSADISVNRRIDYRQQCCGPSCNE